MDCGCFGGIGALVKRNQHGQVKLGYWGIRGLGAPLRMLLEYVGADYEDKQYTDANEWFGKDKPELQKKNALVNLPYVVDGAVVVSQTNAVFEYLGDRYGLTGRTMEEKRLQMQALAEIYDLRNSILELVYYFKEKCRTDGEFKAKMRQHLSEGHKAAYNKLEAWFKQNGGAFSCGNNIGVADFHIFEMLDQHEIYAAKMGCPTTLKACPALSAFYDRFKQLPKLQKYFASPAYKLQCNAGHISYTSKLFGI